MIYKYIVYIIFMFKFLKNTFPFRSLANFTLCFLGFSGVGYFGASYLHK